MSDTPSLQKRLHESYHQEKWGKVLHGLFPDGSLKLFSTPQPLTASQECVKSTHQLGTITLPDGNTIALLEVETSDQVKLARNRVGLRNFVASYIDEAGASAVIAAFHQAKSADWRLTYAARRTILDEETFEITTIETAPKRFTFLLGGNESCRTAAGRLAELAEKGEDLALEDVEKAFSVETLSKEFFKKYKEHYQFFVDHLLAPANAPVTREILGIPICESDKEQDAEDKPIRDFVKTLLGRLVFLHFLQKKGWLGCKAGTKPWIGGDADFLQSFFQLARSKNEAELFHSRFLCPLFFEALNTPDRPGDIFPLTGSRLPYLNGGLFEETSGALRTLDFPPDYFARVLDFFGEYNFTIDENDPDDHEIGIDPEMLSHIFENLLEDNKDKGAFYTPKTIVSHMCRQSLLHYLQSHLGKNKELEILLNEKDPTKHQGKDSFVAKHREAIIKLLDEVKICDPAIGSGAFPIGLLREILWTLLTLQPDLNTPAERAKLKRRIIQNSIHGVDIDPGAIEIARLRFWLALVVDEDEPRPLPNLDYKIHRADSLIEYIRGEPVNLGTETPKNDASKAAVEKLIAAKQGLFSAQGAKEKRAAWLDLYRALAQLAQTEFAWMLNKFGLFAEGEKVAQLDRCMKEFGQWIGQIDAIRKQKVHMQETLLAKLKQWFDNPSKPTFLWNLHFGEIFANGGFDIVVGNPPYVRTKGIPDTYKNLLWDRFDTFEKKADLYVCFLEAAIHLMRPNAFLCFITSSSYLRLDSFARIRKLLLTKGAISELVEFQDNVFESAAVRTAILSFAKDSEIEEINVRVADTAFDAFRQTPTTVPKSFWENNHQNIFDTGYSSGRKLVCDKIAARGVRIENDFDVCFGLKTGDDSKFVAKKPFENNTEKLFRGKNISRWTMVWKGEFVWYDPKVMREHRKTARPGERKRFEEPKVLVRDTGSCLEATFDGNGNFVKDVLIIRPLKDSSEETLKALTSALNSLAVRFFYETTYQTIHVQHNELKRVPLPKWNAADKTRLAELADACAVAAGKNDVAAIPVLEAEINRIVYRLFDLTRAEIALIESSFAG